VGTSGINNASESVGTVLGDVAEELSRGSQLAPENGQVMGLEFISFKIA
jgi:hypothetical protein